MFQARRRCYLFLVALIVLSSWPHCQVAHAQPQTKKHAAFNSQVAFRVGADGRFVIGAQPNATGGRGPQSWSLMYRWPEPPQTSFTTLRINGSDYTYGRDGTLHQTPADIDARTNRSRWQLGDIEVTQQLQIVLNPQTGQEDTVQIAYTVRNLGSANHSVGSRILIDTEINANDGAPFRLPTTGIITHERDLVGAAIPDSFLTFFDVTDSAHVALSQLRSGSALPPSRLVLANWERINETTFDYTPDPAHPLAHDSAYALYWNPTALPPGATHTYVTHYGLARMAADLRPTLALNLDSPAFLTVADGRYIPTPFAVTATVANIGTGPAQNVRLVLTLPDGLFLAQGSTVAALGTLGAGQERQVVWQVAAAPYPRQRTLTLLVQLTATGLPTKELIRTISIPPLADPDAQAPPRHTTSYYVRFTSVDRAIQLGCNARVRGETGLAILDFGSPLIRQSQADGQPVTEYGVQLVRERDVILTPQIIEMVVGYAMGYADPTVPWNRYTCTGVPSNPSALVPPSMMIAVGVSNSALFNETRGIWLDNPHLTAEHGAAWAGMISTLRVRLQSNPATKDRVRAVAGYDSEYYQNPNTDQRDLKTGRRANAVPDADFWTVGPAALAWAEGYTQAARRLVGIFLYNFGSCEDCPRSGNPSTWRPIINGQPQSTTTSQILDRVYRMTWGFGWIAPLPQIYHAPYTSAWYNVRWYAHAVYESNIGFAGTLTQCGSSGCSTADTGRWELYNCGPRGQSCTGQWYGFRCLSDPCPNFPPSRGWQALYDTISVEVAPDGTPNNDLPPQQRMSWATDISFGFDAP